MTMHISRRLAGGVTLLDVSGTLTAAAAADGGSLRSAVAQLADAGFVDIAVNLHGVNELDAHGLGELVRALHAARDRSGRLTLVAAPPRVQKMLSVTRLDTVFDLCGSEAELRARQAAENRVERRGAASDARAAYA
jgi:anti-sigma B factor antagonist